MLSSQEFPVTSVLLNPTQIQVVDVFTTNDPNIHHLLKAKGFEIQCCHLLESLLIKNRVYLSKFVPVLAGLIQILFGPDLSPLLM